MQRSKYKRGVLSTERATKLSWLPYWRWENSTDKWLKNYENYVLFWKENNRDPCINIREEAKLAIWARNQRCSKRGTGCSFLDKDRMDKLEALPFWRWNTGKNKASILYILNRD